MRIALMSDIHSNIYALDAVLDDIRRQGVDLVVNLGDILYGPIAPRATYERLMEEDFLTIRGNQDRQIYEATQTDIDANPTMAFIIEDLGEAPLTWMRSLPATYSLNDDVFFCHGTPEDDLVYLLEDLKGGAPIVRDESDILRLLAGTAHSLICCGHTHLPRLVKTSTQQYIVNPGSVGLPAYADDEPVFHKMQTFSHHASYAIVDGEGADWNVSHKRIDYDVHRAVKAAKERDRLDWVSFLSTGRA
ncbi:metallophosphoesterase family protein [Enterovibrio norvegicus]|uniref:metallophosphoesterase family protein n=1 Tax=Enterovibrio norvegicus TaxID=188144 RepID=UPI003554101A